VDEVARLRGIATQADRHFADAEHGEHVELARRKKKILFPVAVINLKVERPHLGGVAPPPAHTATHRTIGSGGVRSRTVWLRSRVTCLK
jgi:hypothetical protein